MQEVTGSTPVFSTFARHSFNDGGLFISAGFDGQVHSVGGLFFTLL
jgi:hypothetical protein